MATERSEVELQYRQKLLEAVEAMTGIHDDGFCIIGYSITGVTGISACRWTVCKCISQEHGQLVRQKVSRGDQSMSRKEQQEECRERYGYQRDRSPEEIINKFLDWSILIQRESDYHTLPIVEVTTRRTEMQDGQFNNMLVIVVDDHSQSVGP